MVGGEIKPRWTFVMVGKGGACPKSFVRDDNFVGFRRGVGRVRRVAFGFLDGGDLVCTYVYVCSTMKLNRLRVQCMHGLAHGLFERKLIS